jgi:hypothetical protein
MTIYLGIYFFKIMVAIPGTKVSVWIPVKANSIGSALAIADNRCYDSEFRIIDNSILKIEEREYRRLVER